jgi:hypothetical protein
MEFSDLINYIALPDDQVEYEVPTIIPEVLQDYITKHSPIQKPKDARMSLIPS